MAAINGILGSVTFAGGYTTLARNWSMNIEAAPQDLTPLSPTDNHEQQAHADDCLLRGASGSYSCRLKVCDDATLTSDTYDTNPEEWMFHQSCEAREITPLGAAWRTYIDGLKRSDIEIVSYIDDTTALPLAGDDGSATLTAAAATTYSVDYVVVGAESSVDTDDSGRRVVIRANAYQNPTASTLPLSGVSGAATFTAETGRFYTGTILITDVVTRVNRRTSEGSIDFQFVINGELAITAE